MEVSGDFETALFSVESVIHGHHASKAIWSSVLGEQLQCHCEPGNIHDLYVVAVVKPGTGIASHIPR